MIKHDIPAGKIQEISNNMAISHIECCWNALKNEICINKMKNEIKKIKAPFGGVTTRFSVVPF